MDAKFIYCDNLFEIQDFIHDEESERTGNPYNCTFKIKVISNSFSGVAEGCEYDYKEWKKFVEQLDDLRNFKTNEVTLQEIGYGGTVRFIGDKLGHIEVSGLIYGEHMTHSLQFEFTADQTALLSFIRELENL